MKMKNDQDFISYLKHRSEEQSKHHISQKDLNEAPIIGRYLKDEMSQRSKVSRSSKLIFHPDDGITEYRGAEYQFTGKARALLTILNNSKNTTFSFDDIKQKCNPHITNETHHFRADKDARDIVNYIRKNLRVNKGEYFPIGKRNNNWIWIEK